MESDRQFKVGVEMAIREMLPVHKKPIYLYEFAFRANDSLSRYMARGDDTNWAKRVSHADDVLHMFKSPTVVMGINALERDVAKKLFSALLTFMKTGTPSLPSGSPVWKPVDPAEECLNLMRYNPNGEPVMTKVTRISRSEFWVSQSLIENLPGPGI